MDMIVADITRANPSTEHGVLRAIRATYPDAQIRIVYKPSQQLAVTAFPNPGNREVPTHAYFHQLASFIQREFLDSFCGTEAATTATLKVISFHNAVLALRAYVPTKMQNRVEFIYGSLILRNHGANDWRISVNQSQSLSNLMPEAEMLNALTQALRGANAVDATSAVKMTDIRVLLEREDARFKKTSPGGRIPGLIGAIVDLAERKGIVMTNHAIEKKCRPTWLKTPTITLANGNEKTSQPKPHAENVGAQELIQPAPIRFRPENVPLKTDQPNASRSENRTPSRSDHFVNSLRRQGLGPFSSIRQALFDALGIVVTSQSDGKTLIGVVNETIERTKVSVLAKSEGQTIPWRKVKEFLREILTRKPILLASDGTVLCPSLQSLSASVHGLANNWRLELEGELILALLRDKLDLRVADLSFLAGALFNERSDASEIKVADVIQFLIEAKRLTEGPNHSLIEVPSTSATHTGDLLNGSSARMGFEPQSINKN
jgi:hypothetical protein